MYYFEEGKNPYTFKIEERMEHLEEKNGLIRNFLKNKEYKKGLNIIADLLDLSQNGLFDEDKPKTQNFIFTGLKNKTLCLWKMNDWKELEKTCNEYFEHIIPSKKDPKKLEEGKIGQNAQVFTIGSSQNKDKGSLK